MKPAEPQQEHQWLQQLVGDWTYEHEAAMGPDQPKVKLGGSETVRSLGGLWIIGESQGEMPGGGAASMIITLGFDPRSSRYVGTWIGSMMDQLWVYDGELEGNKLSLYAQGPSFSDPSKTQKYRDAIELVSPDYRVFTGAMLGEDGTWHEFMRADYRRKR